MFLLLAKWGRPGPPPPGENRLATPKNRPPGLFGLFGRDSQKAYAAFLDDAALAADEIGVGESSLEVASFDAVGASPIPLEGADLKFSPHAERPIRPPGTPQLLHPKLMTVLILIDHCLKYSCEVFPFRAGLRDESRGSEIDVRFEIRSNFDSHPPSPLAVER